MIADFIDKKNFLRRFCLQTSQQSFRVLGAFREVSDDVLHLGHIHGRSKAKSRERGAAVGDPCSE